MIPIRRNEECYLVAFDRDEVLAESNNDDDDQADENKKE